MGLCKTLLVGVAVVLWAGCGGGQAGPEGESGAGTQDALVVGAPASNSADDGDSGTALSVTASVTATACTAEGQGNVTLAGSASTTGSVDSVLVTVAIDGGEPAQVATLLPQDFLHEGRTKTASYSVVVAVPSGTHTLTVCFTQSGAQGREPKTTCAPPLSVTLACEAQKACEGAEPFGNLVGNPSLCTGKGPPHIPVHVRGDFGQAPALAISGPGGFSHAATLRRAGDSCNYHYNWDAASNGGAGTYTFTVTGGGRTLTFSAALRCGR